MFPSPWRRGNCGTPGPKKPGVVRAAAENNVLQGRPVMRNTPLLPPCMSRMENLRCLSVYNDIKKDKYGFFLTDTCIGNFNPGVFIPILIAVFVLFFLVNHRHLFHTYMYVTYFTRGWHMLKQVHVPLINIFFKLM